MQRSMTTGNDQSDKYPPLPLFVPRVSPVTFSPFAKNLSNPDLIASAASSAIASTSATSASVVDNRSIDVNTIEEIVAAISHLKPGALIIFDLDNTVMEPEQLIGSDQWFEAHIKHRTQILGEEQKKLAFTETIEVYNHVQKNTNVKSVEEQTAQFIDDLHQQHTVIALTTRGKDLTEATIRQLASIDVTFNQAEHVRDKEVDLSSKGPQSHCTQGIIFAGGRDKGACLLHYLEELGYHKDTFTQMVFIDDKQRNVDQVAAAARELGIDYLGIRYGHLDHKIELVDLEVSRVQLEHHVTTGKFLSDEDAQMVLESKQREAKAPRLIV